MTADRILIARPRLRSMQRGKNEIWASSCGWLRYAIRSIT